MFLFLFLLFKNFCLLFIFGCAGSLLLQARFLLLWWVGVTLHFSAGASHCSGFSCRTQVLGAQASVVAARRLRSCGSWAPEWGVFISCCAPAQLLHGMWNLPGPGIKPVSPARAGGFFFTGPPGKSCTFFLVGDFVRASSESSALICFLITESFKPFLIHYLHVQASAVGGQQDLLNIIFLLIVNLQAVEFSFS